MAYRNFLILILSSLLFIFSCKSENKTEPIAQNKSKVSSIRKSDISLGVIPGSSLLYWSCSKPTKTHNGSVSIKDGYISLFGQDIMEAKINMDMHSIKVLDVEGESKERLENHLKGLDDKRTNDFFNVREYPISQFRLNKIVKLNNDSEYSHLIYGDLTIKEVTKEIGFKANIKTHLPSVEISSQEFSINRTEWGIKHLSKNFIDGLTDKFIDDEIRIQFEIKASADL